MSVARILIVEDQAIVARDIHLQLLALGYEPVGQVSTAEEAIRLAGELQPDLVLMDIQLETALDGIAAAQAIRAKYALPVVFITAFAADDVLQRAKQAEPYGYIHKPFTERELHSVVEMALYKHQAEARARELAERNQVILDNLGNGVITISAQGLIESFNKGAGTIFGYSEEQVIAQPVSMLMPESVRSFHNDYLKHDQTERGNAVVCRAREVQGLRQDGSTIPLSLTVSRVANAGKPLYVGILTDLSQHRQAEAKIHSLAFYDELTGLPNRRLLLDRLKMAILACALSDQHGALIFLDLDHFRQINETLGPGYGDDLLREVGLRLQACVREDDTVAHFGGDEFMVMLDALGQGSRNPATHAEVVANKIRQALCEPYSLRGRPYTSSASVGIVMFDKRAGEVDELLKMADAAMYQAKEGGRNTVRFFDPAIQSVSLARTELEKDIQRGLMQQEFVLYYQVQVNARCEPVGAEALVRWMHPVRGQVAPGQFISVAEETGLILPLGQWVLEAACRQLVLWAQEPDTAHWTMAVNVSARQFAQHDFVASVAHTVAQTGANPRLLKLELTESMLLDDVLAVIAKMRSIKDLGVSFSLDDFGTGYSSLTHLKRLPMDQLKIDQSFVRDLLTNPDDAVICQAIVALGHNLGMQVIAEGVETAGQRDFLVNIGCDAFQGYFFAYPVAVDELRQNYLINSTLVLVNDESCAINL